MNYSNTFFRRNTWQPFTIRQHYPTMATLLLPTLPPAELLEVLSATKTALSNSYTQGSSLTYILSIVNTGTIAFTDMTVTDNLGEISTFPTPVYPTDFVEGSIRYYVNGVLQTAPRPLQDRHFASQALIFQPEAMPR